MIYKIDIYNIVDNIAGALFAIVYELIGIHVLVTIKRVHDCKRAYVNERVYMRSWTCLFVCACVIVRVHSWMFVYASSGVRYSVCV